MALRTVRATAVALLTLTLMAGCADTHGRREVACGNLADLPVHARSDVVEQFDAGHCGSDVDEMCQATRAYFSAIDPAPLDPVDALAADTPNDAAMVALTAAFREVEGDIGAVRARDLNRDVVAAARSMEGRHGPIIAAVMQMMPGGERMVTVDTPRGDLVVFRSGIETVVDICFEGRPVG